MREQEESDKSQVALYPLLNEVDFEIAYRTYGSHKNQLSTTLPQACLTIECFPS